MRRVFLNPADIGGRYSALSNFGMVPAALAGIDVRGLLEQAQRVALACGSRTQAKENPGLNLGAILAEAAHAGRDKATFFLSPGIRTFGDWVEQLIAESTGKEGKGILPVVGETIGGPEVYGNDRLFVHIQLESEVRERIDPKLEALKSAGHPMVSFTLPDKIALGQEFYRWEVATATAGSLLGIDAFDQPNVQESKDNTKRLLEKFRSDKKLPEEKPILESGGVKLYGDAALAPNGGPKNDALAVTLSNFLGLARAGEGTPVTVQRLKPSSAGVSLAKVLSTVSAGSGAAATGLPN